MAPRTTVAASLCFSALIGACSVTGPEVTVVAGADAPSAADRFDAEGTHVGHRPVVPRARIEQGNLDENAPERYTVVRGDTLWDISDRFLKEPWLWPGIWNHNPHIANPHLIYPGDELVLEYVAGEPTLTLTRDARRRSTVRAGGDGSGDGGGSRIASNGTPSLGAANGANVTRLSPRIRSESLDDAVPAIPADLIQQFLVRPRVVDLDTVEDAPYVIGNSEGHLVSATNNQIYVRGRMRRDQTRFGVFRPTETLIDPISGELLGHEVTHVADAKLLNIGDPSTFAITGNEMETIVGDILLPVNSAGTPTTFTPRLPEIRGESRIISLVDAISQTGRYQVVVLNIGERSGIEIGDVLAIESRGGSLIDPRGRGGHERVRLPNTRTGVVMVFETFERVSYALVMESTRPVLLNDIVTGI